MKGDLYEETSHKEKKDKQQKRYFHGSCNSFGCSFVLSTTTFLSIAMLQQKETGTTMNSRQAYVSAKSALDIAKELLNDGKLSLPDSGSLYLCFLLC